MHHCPLNDHLKSKLLLTARGTEVKLGPELFIFTSYKILSFFHHDYVHGLSLASRSSFVVLLIVI